MSELPKEVIEALNVITDYISNQTGDDELSFVGATYEVLETGKEFDVVVQDKSEFRNLKETASEMYKMLETCLSEMHGLIDEVNDQRASRITSTTESEPDYHDQETLHLIQLLLAKSRGEQND
ncbi:hypothetical protein VPHK359_0081 [Vibrio phage K359]